MEARGVIILAFIILYMLMCVGVGIWAMRRTKSTRDFFMGTARLQPFGISHAPNRR